MADNTTNNKIVTTVELDVNLAAQEIVKLNSLASDSTAGLSERLDAKNKQIKIQNDLNKKGISDLEKQVKGLRGVVGKEKEYIKATQKLEKAKLNEVKVTERNAKQQRKLADSYDNSKGSLNKLDNATGGMITRLKVLAKSPIILAITVMVGIFNVLKNAIGRSEKATESFAKIGAFVSGILNGLISVLEPIVELLGESLVKAIEKPGEAWESLVGVLQSGFNVWKTQILDRFLGNLKVLSGTFQKGVLKMRIAWNEFTGDSEETTELEKSLNRVNIQIEEGYEAHRIANKQLVDGFNAVVSGVVSFGEKAKDAYDKVSSSTEELANSERRLVENGIALEKQQLTSLRLAEEQRQIRDDTSKSVEDRVSANIKLGKILDDQSERELELARLSLDIARKKVVANGNNIASLEEVGAAEIKILEIRERITGQLSEQIVNEVGLRKEAKDLEKANEQEFYDFKKGLILEESESKTATIERERSENILALENLKITEEEKSQLLLDIDTDYRAKKRDLKLEEDAVDIEAQLELDEIEIQRKRDLGESTLQLELDLLEKKRLQDVSAANLTAKQIEVINTKANKAKKDLKDKEEATDKAVNKAILESGINMAADAFGIAQEVAVAKMLMAAPEALSNVWKNAADQKTLPQIILHGVVGTATVMGPIAKGLKDIKKTRFSKKKGGTGGGGSISASSASSPVGVSNISNLAESNASRLGTNSSLSSRASADAVNGGTLGGVSGNIIFSENAHNSFMDQVNFREDRTTLGG